LPTGLEATFSDSVANGACEGSKIITRTWSLVDNGNASATQIQIKQFHTSIKPKPSDITIYSDANCGYDANVSFTGDVSNKADTIA
jgi:hypothetical protein